MVITLRLWWQVTGIKLVSMSSSIIILGALFVFSLTGGPRQVELQVDGEVFRVYTWQQTVAGVLEDLEVSLGAADVVDPAGGTVVENNLGAIRVTRAFPVRIKTGDEIIEVLTTPQSVAGTLTLAGVAVNGADLVSPGLGEMISPEDNDIIITRVSFETIMLDKQIPFGTAIINDDKAVQGVRRTVQAGRDGEIREEYSITYHNGEEMGRELVRREVISQPVMRIIAQGTRPQVIVASRGGEEIRYRQVLSMQSTAYTHTGNPTYTGIIPYVGIAAVDPRVIPLGTRLYVEGYGPALAADIGSAIKGNKIDVFLDSREQALRWGRRKVEVYVLE